MEEISSNLGSPCLPKQNYVHVTHISNIFQLVRHDIKHSYKYVIHYFGQKHIVFGIYKFVTQYTLANPNRGVTIQKIYVPITEFVRISEVAIIIWRINNTKICDNSLVV